MSTHMLFAEKHAMGGSAEALAPAASRPDVPAVAGEGAAEREAAAPSTYHLGIAAEAEAKGLPRFAAEQRAKAARFPDKTIAAMIVIGEAGSATMAPTRQPDGAAPVPAAEGVVAPQSVAPAASPYNHAAAVGYQEASEYPAAFESPSDGATPEPTTEVASSVAPTGGSQRVLLAAPLPNAGAAGASDPTLPPVLVIHAAATDAAEGAPKSESVLLEEKREGGSSKPVPTGSAPQASAGAATAPELEAGASTTCRGPFDPVADIVTRFRAYKASRVRVSPPAARTRASEIGNPCERAIFYSRTVPSEQRVAHSAELQAIFDLGNDMERIVLRELEDCGFEIVQKGRDYVDEKLELSGHVDAVIRHRSWPERFLLPIEIKGLHPFFADKLTTLEDILNAKQAHLRRYYGQLQTYLYFEAKPLGAFVLKNKSTGWIHVIGAPLDYAFTEGLLKRAERVRDAVRSKTPPPRWLTTECERCPFAHVCAPGMEGGGVQVYDEPEVIAMLERRAVLAPAAAEYKAIDGEVKERFKALPVVAERLVGDFVVRTTEKSRKAYSVGPATWQEFAIEKLKAIAAAEAPKRIA